MNQLTQFPILSRIRVPVSRLTATILGGDLIVLFAFIATGQYTHHYYFWELPVHTLLVILPFAIAWLLVAPLVGLFSLDRIVSYRDTVVLVVVAWTVGTVIGGLIRSTAYFPGGMPTDFLLANLVFGMLFFVPWRLFVSWQLR